MAVLLVSCNKQEEVFVPEDKTVEMTIVASSDETKTVLGDKGTVTWSDSGEQLAVMEVAYGAETTTAKKASKNGVTTDEGATMTFGVSLNSKTATSFDYYALYPNSAYVDTPSDFTNVKVNLASTQAPTESSFGPSADVLVAKPVTGLTTQPTELNLQFARVIAVGKMKIKDLNTTEKVKKITFTAADKAVTGISSIDFTTAAGVVYGDSGQGVDNVVLDYSGKNIVANGMTANFTCWPFTLAAGETFSVVVETESLIFTKNITLEGKSLAFNVGRASAFNVSFNGIEGVKKIATYTVTSTSAVSVSGVTPSGSSATYSSTYSSKCQLTKGSSMTLTLSGYEGMIVKGITLSMKSNKSSGAGYLSVKAGTTTLSSIGSSNSGVDFNTASWHGGWSQSYVNVKPTLSNNAYTVKDGEDLVIVIGATANSLYCQSFTIEYVADPSFVGGSTGGGSGSGEGGGEPGGETPTEQTVFLETFGSTSSTPDFSKYTGYSATEEMFTTTGNVNTHYSGSGKIGKKDYSAINLSSGYADASGLSGCYHSGTANTEATILKISDINIKDCTNISVSFGALGASSSHKVSVYYSIDGGTETTLIKDGAITNKQWTLLNANISGKGESLTLIFKHKPTSAWIIRMDDIKVLGTK